MQTKNKKLLRLRKFLEFKYGVEKGFKRYLSFAKANNLRKYVFLHGEEEGKKKYAKRIEIDKFKNTLASYIKKFGEQEGTKRYYQKNKNLSVGFLTLKNKGLTDDEIRKIKDNHSKKSAQSLENFCERYGQTEGTLRYNTYVTKNRRSCRSIKDYIKLGYTEKEAKERVREVQVRDKTFFIKKYGLSEGIAKYKEVNKKKARSTSKAYYVQKHGQEKGLDIYNDIIKRRTKRLFSPGKDSLMQLDFASELYKRLEPEYQPHFKGAPVNKNKIIGFKSNKYGIKYCIPDIIIGNLVIEFDGKYWHSLSHILEKDRQKNELLNEKGYTTVRIQENEYKNNKDAVLTSTLQFIYENYKY